MSSPFRSLIASARRCRLRLDGRQRSRGQQLYVFVVSVGNTWGLGADIGIYFGGGAVGKPPPRASKRAARCHDTGKR